MGFTRPLDLRLRRWALTPPFHPYLRISARRFLFCGTFREPSLEGQPPTFTPAKQDYMASSPVEFGLSSPAYMMRRRSSIRLQPKNGGTSHAPSLLKSPNPLFQNSFPPCCQKVRHKVIQVSLKSGLPVSNKPTMKQRPAEAENSCQITA